MKDVPIAYEGTLLFKKKNSENLFPLNIEMPEKFKDIEQVLIETIDRPVVVEMVLEYTFGTDVAQTTAADAFEDARKLLGEMK